MIGLHAFQGFLLFFLKKIAITLVSGEIMPKINGIVCYQAVNRRYGRESIIAHLREIIKIDGSDKKERRKQMSKLLLDEKPLLIIPSLAKKVGLNESIILQQIHYWLQISDHTYEGYKWMYNTYDKWAEQFPWWSKATIRRLITKLEKLGIIITGNFNKMKMDKTKWYRINYDALNDMSSPCAQNEQSRCSKLAVEEPSLSTPLPESTTEITSDSKKEEEATSAVYHFFEQNGFGTISPYIAESIHNWIRDLSEELVIEAMKTAVENNSRNWRYVSAVLKDWSDKKIKTVKEVHAAQMAFRKRQSQHRKGNKTRKELTPDWLKNEQAESKEEEPSHEMSAEQFEREREELLQRIRNYKEKPK
ncbi:DnaD domain protein [Metabacillus fastidiosus]|uniref:DnaD domain-containing protein n=1 Tax=Metabacillus fastidiosus TaxID=1458 RepID=UPI002E1E680E|nr:DnaD domain protein [Metabacillus fastidiosus]MED4455122.1 DnaD domain protein [Metabacillus fastidiosus]